MRTVLLLAILSSVYPLSAGAAPQYKKQNRDAIAWIEDGRPKAAIQHFQSYLKDNPDDLESMYGLAVAYAAQGDCNEAYAWVEKAVGAGLPLERFLAGPRELLQPLYDHKPFKRLRKSNDCQILHGPMIRATDSSVCIWVRSAAEHSVTATVSPASGGDPLSARSQTNVQKDYTAIVTVTELQPDTEYTYTVRLGDQPASNAFAFTTLPKQGSKARFDVGFGGGAGYTPWFEHMWSTIAHRQLLAFLFLGDNVYIDHPEHPATQRYCYYRRQSRPEYRRFVAGTSIFSIWDDHDFTINDGRGGPEIDTPPWKRSVWEVYQQNWLNPYYGGGKNNPGCYFDTYIADVHFILLDGRYYRTDPKKPSPSMLGPVQLQWLMNILKASRGTFKVLCSPVPWSKNTKPGSLDTWDGYNEEREAIFHCIETNGIEGVFLLAADRHRSDIWRTIRPKGYDLYEFESSKISNIHTHKPMPDALFSYNEKCSFGLLSFDTTLDDPQVVYRIISIDNEEIHSFPLKLSQLTTGN